MFPTGKILLPLLYIILREMQCLDTKEDLEDWLLSQNPEFIKKMRKARKEDIGDRGKDWKSLKNELSIK